MHSRPHDQRPGIVVALPRAWPITGFIRVLALMYSASLRQTIDDPWRSMKPLRVGRAAAGPDAPSVFVTVDRDGQPYCRIDAYCESRGPFCEMLVWHDFVVLGWSDVVHVVHPASRRVQNVICDGYFGHLYAYDRSLLIASASELICLNEQAIELWRRGDLGIDGVTIDRVNNGLIEGQGEWDPPGGWRAFRLAADTGKPVR